MSLSLLLAAALACSAPSDPSVAPKLERLAQDAQLGKWWTGGWTSALSVGAIGQFTLAALIEDDGYRADFLVGGVTSAVGVVAVLVTRPHAAAELRALGPCPAGEEVDAAITRIAKEERFARAWYQHVLGIAFNLGAGLYLGLAHERWGSGAIQAGVGIAVSEAMILTYPHRTLDLTLAPLLAPERSAYGVTLSVPF